MLYSFCSHMSPIWLSVTVPLPLSTKRGPAMVSGAETVSATFARKAYGDHNLHVGESLNNLCSYANELEHWADAVRYGLEAVTVLRGALPAKHPSLGKALANVAYSLVRAGRPAEAVPLAEEAVAIAAASGNDDEMGHAHARFALGAALAESGQDRARGRTLVEQARDAYAGAGKLKWRLEADVWLEKNGK